MYNLLQTGESSEEIAVNEEWNHVKVKILKKQNTDTLEKIKITNTLSSCQK